MAKLKLIAFAFAAGIAVPASAEAHGYVRVYPQWGYVEYGAPYPYYDREYRRAAKRAEKDYRKHLKREAKVYKKLRRAEEKYYARYGYPYASAYAYGPSPYRYVGRY